MSIENHLEAVELGVAGAVADFENSKVRLPESEDSSESVKQSRTERVGEDRSDNVVDMQAYPSGEISFNETETVVVDGELESDGFADIDFSADFAGGDFIDSTAIEVPLVELPEIPLPELPALSAGE